VGVIRRRGRDHGIEIGVVLALLVAGLGVWLLTGGEDDGSAAVRAGTVQLTVDRGSRGGECDDGRPASEVDPAHPWCSLRRAVAAAPPGATVVVRRGSYPRLTVTKVRHSRMVTLRARVGEQPRVDGVTVSGSANLRIDGMRITGLSRIEDSDHIQVVDSDMSPNGFGTSGGSDLLFARDDFHDLTIDLQPASVPGPRCNSFTPNAGLAPRCGFGLRIGGTARVVVRDSRFRNIPADAIQASATTGLQILRNRFDHIAPFIDTAEHSDTIQFVGGNVAPVIRQNIITRARGVIAIPDDGNVPGNMSNGVIEDNVFAGPGDFAVKLWDATGVRFVGNTAWGTSHGVQLLEHSDPDFHMTGVVLQDNLIQLLDAKTARFAQRDHNLVLSGGRVPGEIGGAPRFGTGYHLTRGSRGIAKGTTSAAPRPDVHGHARPAGTPVDLGAVQGR
jgi:hypothetical protein